MDLSYVPFMLLTAFKTIPLILVLMALPVYASVPGKLLNYQDYGIDPVLAEVSAVNHEPS